MTQRPDQPGPLLRRGPRPLLLHLTLAMLRSTASASRSPPWNAGWPNSSAANGSDWAPTAADLLKILQDALRTGGGLDSPHAGEALRQDAALIQGIAAYRRHPQRRLLADPPTLWTEGDTRLLDYGHAAGGIPVLFVPSLINRAYVLDLTEGGSMLRWLAGQGVRPLLLDWGWPGQLERRFTLTDYIAGRMERGMAAAAQAVGEPVVLAGYCMGGTMAVAAAQRRPDLVRGLALLAAPWDFHAAEPQQAQRLAQALPALEPALRFNHTMSVDLLQSLFTLLDPDGVARKYRSFAALPQDSARAERFVALEDWLNDGVPLAAEVARACLGEWYGQNAPAQGTWRVAGLTVEPGAIAVPTFVAAPHRDRIVPPQSSRPLAEAIPGAQLHEPPAGHVGMVAGARAEAVLWQPLQAWLQSIGPRLNTSRQAGRGGHGPAQPQRPDRAAHDKTGVTKIGAARTGRTRRGARPGPTTTWTG